MRRRATQTSSSPVLGVYRSAEGEPVFHEAGVRTTAELRGLLVKIISRIMRVLTRQGFLVEEQGMTYWADIDPDNPLRPLQAASCTYRIAFGPRAGQKVLSLQTLPMNLPARAGSTMLPSRSTPPRTSASTLPSPPGRRVGDEGRDATVGSWAQFAARAPWRLARRGEPSTPALCANAPGFSLHAAVRRR